MREFMSLFTLWKLDSKNYPMPELMGAVSLWRSGEGCGQCEYTKASSTSAGSP